MRLSLSTAGWFTSLTAPRKPGPTAQARADAVLRWQPLAAFVPERGLPALASRFARQFFRSFDTGACSNGEATCSIALNIGCATADEARSCFAAALKAGATEAHKFEQGPWQTEGELTRCCRIQLDAPHMPVTASTPPPARALAAGSLFGAVRDSWGFRWTIDFEPVVDRLKFAAKIMADIAAAEVASSSS